MFISKSLQYDMDWHYIIASISNNPGIADANAKISGSIFLFVFLFGFGFEFVIIDVN